MSDRERRIDEHRQRVEVEEVAERGKNGNGKRKLLVESPATAVKDWMIGLRQALFDAVTEGDVKEIAQGLVERAKKGDMAATKLVLTYLVGGGGLHLHNHQTIIQPSATSPKAIACQNGKGK